MIQLLELKTLLNRDVIYYIFEYLDFYKIIQLLDINKDTEYIYYILKKYNISKKNFSYLYYNYKGNCCYCHAYLFPLDYIIQHSICCNEMLLTIINDFVFL